MTVRKKYRFMLLWAWLALGSKAFCAPSLEDILSIKDVPLAQFKTSVSMALINQCIRNQGEAHVSLRIKLDTATDVVAPPWNCYNFPTFDSFTEGVQLANPGISVPSTPLSSSTASFSKSELETLKRYTLSEFVSIGQSMGISEDTSSFLGWVNTQLTDLQKSYARTQTATYDLFFWKTGATHGAQYPSGYYFPTLSVLRQSYSGGIKSG